MSLEKAIQIAVEAHAGTKDKGGKAYILHPISVMMRVETEEEKINKLQRQSGDKYENPYLFVPTPSEGENE